MTPDPIYSFEEDTFPRSFGNRCVNWFLTGLGFLAALALVSGVIWGVCWP